MLEVVAMVLFAVWAIGLVTGNSLAGGIHVLLLGGLVAAFFHHRAASRARSNALMGSSRQMANAMGAAVPPRRPISRPKPAPGAASRPSAAA